MFSTDGGMAALNYPGQFCKDAGILCDALMLESAVLPILREEDLNKGIDLELNQFRVDSNLSWQDFHEWIVRLCPVATIPSFTTMKVNISHLESKIKELKRNKQHVKLHDIMNEAFIHLRRGKDTTQYMQPFKTSTGTVEFEVLFVVNHELACELTTAKDALALQEMRANELSSKLSKLNVRTMNKKLRRRDEKITRLKEEVKEKRKFEDRVKRTKLTAQRYRVNLWNAKKRADCIVKETKQLYAQTKLVDKEMIELRKELYDVVDERDSLLQRILELQLDKFETKEHRQKYLDNVRQCCIELLSMNVGIKNVEPVIRCVLKHMTGIMVDELPQSTTLVRMLAEMKGLSCQQIVEELHDHDNLTLHSDRTTKFGQHYYSFQVSTPSSTYSLGLSEMLTGSTTQVLHTFRQILSDVELVAGPKAGGLILAKIKNTMSEKLYLS